MRATLSLKCVLVRGLTTSVFGLMSRKLRTRSKYSIDGAYAWSNESINVIHRKHKYQLNQQCEADL